jgi:hypothetical protein
MTQPETHEEQSRLRLTDQPIAVCLLDPVAGQSNAKFYGDVGGGLLRC